MLLNYLKTSLRNLLRHTGYTIINVWGLTIGLATGILIFAWVFHQLSYNEFHTNLENIYRASRNVIYNDGTIQTIVATPGPLADALKQEVPGVADAARVRYYRLLFRNDETAFYERGVYADASFFNIFSFPLIAGNTAQPLPNLNSVAISRRLAAKYFPGEDAIGKTVRIDQKFDASVTAVFDDVPANSTLQFDFVILFDVWLNENTWAREWGNNNIETYFLTSPETTPASMAAAIKGVIRGHCDGCPVDVIAVPLSDIHLRSKFSNGEVAGGLIDTVLGFSIAAVIILTIACINFMNLATARASTRSREVGIRKVVGAQRAGLATQFLGEAMLLTVISLMLALASVQLLLPHFNDLTNTQLKLPFGNWTFLGGIVVITLGCGFLSGSYPAFVLSSFRPSQVLKGNLHHVLTGASLRRVLVVVQFAVSTFLIIGSVIVNQQINFITDSDLGYDISNIIVLERFDGAVQNADAFRNELLKNPHILEVATANTSPFQVQTGTNDPVWPGKQDEIVSFDVIVCDKDLIPALQMDILEGRNFTDLNNQDSSNYIINEAAMVVMGLNPSNVVGTDLDMWNGKGKIIGLVRDFNSDHLRNGIDPLVFVYSPAEGGRIFVKTDGQIEAALTHVRQVHLNFDPGYPFEYRVMEDQFTQQYQSEHTLGGIAGAFTIIAVVISCLGLLGLSAFTAERRMKELSIRKILGASVGGLIVLLCADFVKLVVVALAIAAPVAWYAGAEYLGTFAFHTDIDVVVFIATAVGLLAMSAATVAWQTRRVTTSSPTDILRQDQ